MYALGEWISEFQAQGITLLLSGLKEPIHDILKRALLVEKIGEDPFFLQVHDAVLFIEDDE